MSPRTEKEYVAFGVGVCDTRRRRRISAGERRILLASSWPIGNSKNRRMGVTGRRWHSVNEEGYAWRVSTHRSTNFNTQCSNDCFRPTAEYAHHTVSSDSCMRRLFVVGARGRTYLDAERNRCTGDMSPPSDNVIFDNQCYATTPSSSNGNSDMEQPTHCNSRRCNSSQTYQQQSMQSVSTPGSPTSRLLLEYEMHLRNTLAKGMDAESYSLRTFEALLTQSMENLGESQRFPYSQLSDLTQAFFPPILQNLQKIYRWTFNARLTFLEDVSLSDVQLLSSMRFANLFDFGNSLLWTLVLLENPRIMLLGPNSNKSSTLPLSYRYCNERQNSKDSRDGYYSDRNEMIREKRDRDVERDRGYLSDYNSR